MFGGMDDELPDTGADDDGASLAGLEGMHGADTGADDLNGLGEVDYTPSKHDKLQQIISKLGQDCQGVGGKLQGCRDQRRALVLQRQAKVERTAALKLEIKQKESAISEVVLSRTFTRAEISPYSFMILSNTLAPSRILCTNMLIQSLPTTTHMSSAPMCVLLL